MLEAFFGFKKMPFGDNPDGKQLFPSQTYTEAKARLQSIEAAANRSLSRSETDLMLRRLAASQEQFPLALEMASLEQEALRELDQPKP